MPKGLRIIIIDEIKSSGIKQYAKQAEYAGAGLGAGQGSCTKVGE